MNESSQERGKIAPTPVVDIMTPDEVDEPYSSPVLHKHRIDIPIFLLIATCLSVLFVGTKNASVYAGTLSEAFENGLMYATSLMTILLCHETGHYLQTRRYGVLATWPFFIPIPMPPIGTMGAVIVMEPRMGHRRALFDIGIAGPLAGLVPTIICCIVGIRLTTMIEPTQSSIQFPLLFDWLFAWLGKESLPGYSPILHPIAYAGWVGLLITSINLFPIGQLDGGHVLYALLKKNSRFVSAILLLAALICVGKFELWGWSVMIIVLLVMGAKHPPTADDEEPLGFFRFVLGWLTLAFIVIGFTPHPFNMK